MTTTAWYRDVDSEVEVDGEILGNDWIRRIEAASIQAFILSCAGIYADKTVLDYGCGRQPYRELIEDAGAEYIGFDRAHYAGTVTGRDIGPDAPHRRIGCWDVILCNQIMQFVQRPAELLGSFRRSLKPGGALLLTFTTNWDENEAGDLHRFTASGMRRLLENARFAVERLERRASVDVGGFKFPLGYAVVARA